MYVGMLRVTCGEECIIARGTTTDRVAVFIKNIVDIELSLSRGIIYINQSVR